MSFVSINPATGRILKSYETLTLSQIDTTLNKVHHAGLEWKNTLFPQRSRYMNNIAGILKDRADELSRLMAQEMGKPVGEGRAEILKCSWVCDYYAKNAEQFLKDEMIGTDARSSYVRFDPLGTILAIMPWNFPFWQVFRCAAPALMAGNTVVLKHALNVPECALEIEKMFLQAGFPDACFKSMFVENKIVDYIIQNPVIKAVTLTGSTRAGKSVAAKAGSLLKKTVMELGGSDPYIILDDADIESAVEICVKSRMLNSGQSCIAAKRFIVDDAIRNDFKELFVERMKKIKMGDPFDPDVNIGPLARFDLRDVLESQVKKSIEKGAKCLLGGVVPKSAGAYYPPTILSDVEKGMPAFDQELFGPVAALISAADETEAVIKANDSAYGLGAAVFTKDIERAELLAKQLESGCCFINDFVKSDPRLPFGGVKESGYGRELSHYGIKEFVNIKTVYIK